MPQYQTLLPCQVPGCSKTRRAGHSRYCGGHTIRNIKYGHPLARPVFPREYKHHEQTVEALFDQHPDHPAIQAALNWLSRFLAGNDLPQHPARLWLGGMLDNGMSPRTVLIRTVAAWLLTFEKEFPGGLKGEDHVIGRAVLRLSPCMKCSPCGQPSDWPAKAVRALATTLRHTLAPLLGNVRTALATEQAQKAAQVNALATPF